MIFDTSVKKISLYVPRARATPPLYVSDIRINTHTGFFERAYFVVYENNHCIKRYDMCKLAHVL